MGKLIFSLLIIVASGCQPWPPFEKEIRQNFEVNRAAFDRLASKFDEADQRNISRNVFLWMADGELFFRVQTPERHRVQMLQSEFLDGNEILRNVLITDDAEWSILMNQAGVLSLTSGNNDLIAFALGGQKDESRITFIAYHRSHTSKAKLVLCESAFEELDCGRCKLNLPDDWYVFYTWWPTADVISRHGEAVTEELWNDEDAYLDALTSSHDKCSRIGDKVIGYQDDPFE